MEWINYCPWRHDTQQDSPRNVGADELALGSTVIPSIPKEYLSHQEHCCSGYAIPSSPTCVDKYEWEMQSWFDNEWVKRFTP